jgi:hypothetical protein
MTPDVPRGRVEIEVLDQQLVAIPSRLGLTTMPRRGPGAM